MFENYADYEYYLARIQIVLLMLGMGATLSVFDFARVFRHPRSLLAGLAFHFVGVPLIALLVIRVANPAPGVAVGILLIALMPSATLSKFFAHLGKGNMALTITMTVCTTLATLFTVPLMLGLLAGDYASNFAAPVDEVIPLVGLYLLLPLTVGIVIGMATPKYKKLFSRWCVILGWCTVALMVIGALGSGHIRPGDYGWQVHLAIIAFCLLIQQASMVPFYICRWPRPDRLAVGIETTMRNMNLAILLVGQIFPAHDDPHNLGGDALFVVLYYAAVAMIAGFPLALNHLRLARRTTPDHSPNA